MLADTVSQLSSKWWTFLLRGIVALAVAACAFVLPAPTAAALVFVFAAYFIISGIVSMLAGFSFSGAGHWWAFVLLGLVQVVLGLMVLGQPGAGALALAYLFAIWMVMTGMTEISGAIALRSHINNEFWLVLLGIISLAFGFYVIWRPDIGLLTLVYTLGFYATFAGIALIGFAFRIKSVGSNVATQHAHA